jgi:copper oxidase (laccase) domain-containing protein
MGMAASEAAELRRIAETVVRLEERLAALEQVHSKAARIHDSEFRVLKQILDELTDAVYSRRKATTA